MVMMVVVVTGTVVSLSLSFVELTNGTRTETPRTLNFNLFRFLDEYS